jgi:outer membrane protein assembly factor BamA
MKKVWVIFVLILCTQLLFAQSKERSGWGWGGVPAINYNADEGFGYGVVGNIFYYSKGGYSPYFWTIQPQLFFTTGGKQEHWIFFDSPFILGPGYRITAELKMLKQQYNSYYGLGNNSIFNEAFIEVDKDDNPVDTTLFKNKYYYTHYRGRISFTAQIIKAFKSHPNGRPLLSMLAGVGVINTENKLDENITKLGEDLQSGIITQKEIDGGFSNYLKLGVIHDTRDNEPAPNSGHWTDIVTEVYTKVIGSDWDFIKLTLTDRRYFRLLPRVVYAQRVVFEKMFGDPPFYELSFYGSSYKIDEGLGGSKSLRGILKSRYLGEMKAFANTEIRYRFLDFSAFNQDFYLATNVFFDFGKVWSDRDPLNENNLKNLRYGYGAGLHIGWNENFIIAVDGGTSEETGLQLYIGLGFLY